MLGQNSSCSKHAIARKSFEFRVWRARGEEFSKKGRSSFVEVRVFGRICGSSFVANQGPMWICILVFFIARRSNSEKGSPNSISRSFFSIAIGPILAGKACIWILLPHLFHSDRGRTIICHLRDLSKARKRCLRAPQSCVKYQQCV